MALKIPEELIAQQPADPLESRVGVEGYLKNLRDLVFGSGPEAALSPGNFLAPVGMGKIPKELLDSVINARGKKFHGTQSLGDLIEIVTGGLNAGKTPSNLGRVSTSRSPHVSHRFGPFIVELNPEMIRTRPIAEPGFRKKNSTSFEAEEGLLAAQPEAIDRILVDQDHLDQMFKTARKPEENKWYQQLSPGQRQSQARQKTQQYEALIDFAVANNIPVIPFAGRKETKLSKLVNTKRPGVEPRRGSPTAPRPLERAKDIESAKGELKGQKAPFTNVLDQMDELMFAGEIPDDLGLPKPSSVEAQAFSKSGPGKSPKITDKNAYEVLDAMLAAEDTESIKQVALGANLSKKAKEDYTLAYETITGQKLFEQTPKPKPTSGGPGLFADFDPSIPLSQTKFVKAAKESALAPLTRYIEDIIDFGDTSLANDILSAPGNKLSGFKKPTKADLAALKLFLSVQ